MKAVDLTNMIFGELSVTNFSHTTGLKRYWNCVCSCGSVSCVDGGSLRSGNTKSCGHNSANTARVNGMKAFKHGENRSVPEYIAWGNIKRRCAAPSDISYPHYGARGITMCDSWLNSYENFLADMGRKPTAAHSIDRIDPTGNYEPTNCRWATRIEQGRNKTNNRMLTHNGTTKTLAAWAEDAGVSYSIFAGRVRHGWSMDSALSGAK